MSDSRESRSDSDVSDSDGETSYEKHNFGGMILENKYLLLKQIGSGSFATVWLSYHVYRKRFFAIKIQYAEEYVFGEEEVELFNKFSKDKCEYINKIVEHFIFRTDYGEHICMVFNLMAGSLFDIMRTGVYSKGLPVKTVKVIAFQLLTALDVINDKYQKIHTDIKPENILLVGTDFKTKEFIDRFRGFDFDSIVREKKRLVKKRKDMSQKERDHLAVELASEEIIKKMDIDDYHTSDSYHSGECCSHSSSSSQSEDVDSSSSSSEDDSYNPIDSKYLDHNTICTKLSDFGNCCDISYKLYDIQTRYYRAPEIILKHPYNETCDIWSVGCTIYELLTGKILFNPHKKKRFNRDRSHIYLFQNTLGRIPAHIINKSDNKKLFFKKNGTMKGRNYIKYDPLYKLIFDKLKDVKDVDDVEIENFVDLLYNIFQYDPHKRPSAKDCLKHKWFSEFKSSKMFKDIKNSSKFSKKKKNRGRFNKKKRRN